VNNSAARRTKVRGRMVPILIEHLLGSDGFSSYSTTMNQSEKAVLEALLQLEAAVDALPTANPKPNLQPLFARIDELTGLLPRGTDPNLLHYLHKKSYEKARLFLQGRDAENQEGNCAHV
jgi:hypothetical protein